MIAVPSSYFRVKRPLATSPDRWPAPVLRSHDTLTDVCDVVCDVDVGYLTCPCVLSDSPIVVSLSVLYVSVAGYIKMAAGRLWVPDSARRLVIFPFFFGGFKIPVPVPGNGQGQGPGQGRAKAIPRPRPGPRPRNGPKTQEVKTQNHLARVKAKRANSQWEHFTLQFGFPGILPGGTLDAILTGDGWFPHKGFRL